MAHGLGARLRDGRQPGFVSGGSGCNEGALPAGRQQRDAGGGGYYLCETERQKAITSWAVLS